MDDEPRDADDDRGLSAARLRGRRVALALVTVVAVAFIVSSTAQITRAVFGIGLEPLPAGAAAGSPEQLCASGIQALARALDRADDRRSSLASSLASPVASARSDGDPPAALRPGLSPEWDRAEEVRTACNAARGGPSAWASLERLRFAEEQSGRLGRDVLSSIRSDVAAHLPADLR